VGVPATAGTGVWPYGAWAERRRAVTGKQRDADTAVVRDVETVLAAMRHNRPWYEKFVERPLGRKQAPPVPADGTDPDRGQDRPYLALTQRHESDDARLLELAAMAVAAIEDRLGSGENPVTAVLTVLTIVFGGGTGAEQMDTVPGTVPTEDERLAALLADPDSLSRIVAEVLDIVSGA
jgi:hypothetical protein